jgi:competence protein ComEC
MISSLAKIGLCFILGITITTSYLLFCISIASILLASLINSRKRRSSIFSVLILLSSLFSGFVFSKYQENKIPNYGTQFRLESTILKISSVSNKSKVTSLTGLIHLSDQTELKVRVNVFNDSRNYSIGETLILKNLVFKRIIKSSFPYKTDFNVFLIQKGVYYSCNSDSTSILKIGKDPSIFTLLFDLKTSLIRATKNHLKDNYDIVSAICLGDKQELDKNSKNTFVNNGIAHIMAVSGLHIGILYLVIFQFLKLFFNKSSRILILLIVLSIWFFVLLTGAPISAVRAAIMISIYSCFKILDRKHEKLHILVFTALIILIWNPSELYSVGFQLSFLALVGILYFSEPILSIYHPKTILSKYIWDIIGITLAVQITTFPLIIFYFHAFPIHFLITNIIAIPFAFSILILFVLSILFSFWNFAYSSILFILDAIIAFTLSLFNWFEQFEFLYLKGLYLSPSALILYYITLIILMISQDRRPLITKLFIAGSIAFIVQVFQMKSEKSISAIYVFDDKGIGLLYKAGLQTYLFSENENYNTTYYHPIIQNNLISHHLKNNSLIQIGDYMYLFNPISDSLFNTSYDGIFCSDYKSYNLAMQKHSRNIFITKKLSWKIENEKAKVIKDFIKL